MTRFALAALFAVLVAASRPVTTGGHHDLMAVGVVLVEGRGGVERTRTVLAAPTEMALEAYDALLRSPARAALLQGTTVYAGTPPDEGDGPAIRELVFYGHRSRKARTAVLFEGEGWGPAAGAALGAARDLAGLPPSVTAASARVLLVTESPEALREALEALAAVRSDVAAAEALGIATDGGDAPARRIVALRMLKGMGGRSLYPEAFERLASDPVSLVAAEASE